MTIKREDLKAGKKYTLGCVDSSFEILAVYKDYHWIRWVDDDDVESVYFENSELNHIEEET